MHGEQGPTSVRELRNSKNYRWCTSELDINEPIKVFGGVMAGDGSLVRIEEYVAFSHAEYDKVYYCY